MNRRMLATTALSAAIGLAAALQAPSVGAQGMKSMSDVPAAVKANMMKMKEQHLQKCYGINAVAKNDCAEGRHSCVGQATRARDPQSFVMLPAGVCGKIAGGKLAAS